jgi:hypothetical protein
MSGLNELISLQEAITLDGDRDKENLKFASHYSRLTDYIVACWFHAPSAIITLHRVNQ